MAHRKARKRHAIQGATALDNHEDPGEYVAQVKPIPIAPRMRRTHFFVTTSVAERQRHGSITRSVP